MRTTRVFDDGDGTVSIARDKSLNTAKPLEQGELARLPYDYELPTCPAKYYAWNGADVIEADQSTKDTVDTAIAAKEQAQEEAQAPDTGFANLDRRDRFVLRCLWRLAKQHWPDMTFEAFLTELRTEWDETK